VNDIAEFGGGVAHTFVNQTFGNPSMPTPRQLNIAKSKAAGAAVGEYSELDKPRIGKRLKRRGAKKLVQTHKTPKARRTEITQPSARNEMPYLVRGDYLVRMKAELNDNLLV